MAENEGFAVIPATPFSWSQSRLRVFSQCRRRYFFKHYAWENSVSGISPERHETVKLLKNLKTLPRLASELTAKAVRKTFLSGERGCEAFFRELSLLFSRAASDIEAETWRADIKAPNLFEAYYGGGSPALRRRLVSRLKLSLKAGSEKLAASELFRELCGTEPLQFIQMKPPLSFSAPNITVWLAPELLWRGRGLMKVLFFRAPAENFGGEAALSSSLAAMLLSGKYMISPDKIIFMFFSLPEEDGACESAERPSNVTPKDIAKAAEKVRQSSAEMLALLKDGIARESDFAASQSAACAFCEFQAVCPRK